MSKFQSPGSGKTSATFQDTNFIDSFGRLRVSDNNVLLSSNHARNYEGDYVFETQETGADASASYDATRASFLLQPGTGSGNTVIRQTKEYFTYRTGHSHKALFTFTDMHPVSGVIKRVGLFDDNDGIFLETSGSDTNIVVRSSVNGTTTENRVNKSEWSEYTFSGEDPHRFTLDLSKGNIFQLDFQWLGVGRVRTSFIHSEGSIEAHRFLNVNVKDEVYMRTPHLPVRYEIQNFEAQDTSPQLEQICSSVAREGGQERTGIESVANCYLDNLTATTTPRSSMSLRLKQRYNRIPLVFESAEFLNRGNEPVVFKVILNPTLTGGTLSWLDANLLTQRSITQLAYTADSGVTLLSKIVPASTKRSETNIASNFLNALKLASNIAGESDIVSIIVESASGTQVIDASLSFIALT